MKNKIKEIKRLCSINITLIILLTCIVTACQPTPNKQVVEQKGSNLQEAIQQTAVPSAQAQQEEAAHWQYEKTYDSGHCLIVDAAVLNKNKTAIPVITVKEKPFEDGAQIESIVSLFCPEAKVYDKPMSLMRSQIEEQIILLEKELDQLKQGIDDGVSYELSQEHKALSFEEIQSLSKEEILQANIDELKEAYQNAPDEADLEQASFTLKDVGGSHQSNMIAYDNDHITYFDFVNWSVEGSNCRGSDFFMEDAARKATDYQIDRFVNPSLFSDDITFQNEKKQIDALVANMKIDYMQLDTVCKGENGYCYYYTRTENGLLETYTNTHLGTQTLDSDGTIVMDLLTPEFLQIETLEGRVMKVHWKNPSDVVVVDNDNVRILAWEKVQERFLQQMDFLLSPEPLSNLDTENTSVFAEATQIHINRIELGFTKVLMKDSEGDYKLIPTWSFIGYDENAVPSGVTPGSEICFVTINALDGSIIDRGVMY